MRKELQATKIEFKKTKIELRNWIKRTHGFQNSKYVLHNEINFIRARHYFVSGLENKGMMWY
jgi:hypothetical protein